MYTFGTMDGRVRNPKRRRESTDVEKQQIFKAQLDAAHAYVRELVVRSTALQEEKEALERKIQLEKAALARKIQSVQTELDAARKDVVKRRRVWHNTRSSYPWTIQELVISFLPRGTWLQARRVNKRWRDGVDQLIAKQWQYWLTKQPVSSVLTNKALRAHNARSRLLQALMEARPMRVALGPFERLFLVLGRPNPVARCYAKTVDFEYTTTGQVLSMLLTCQRSVKAILPAALANEALPSNHHLIKARNPVWRLMAILVHGTMRVMCAKAMYEACRSRDMRYRTKRLFGKRAHAYACRVAEMQLKMQYKDVQAWNRKALARVKQGDLRPFKDV